VKLKLYSLQILVFNKYKRILTHNFHNNKIKLPESTWGSPLMSTWLAPKSIQALTTASPKNLFFKTREDMVQFIKDLPIWAHTIQYNSSSLCHVIEGVNIFNISLDNSHLLIRFACTINY